LAGELFIKSAAYFTQMPNTRSMQRGFVPQLSCCAANMPIFIKSTQKNEAHEFISYYLKEQLNHRQNIFITQKCGI
jgi:hypothetical protein